MRAGDATSSGAETPAASSDPHVAAGGAKRGGKAAANGPKSKPAKGGARAGGGGAAAGAKEKDDPRGGIPLKVVKQLATMPADEYIAARRRAFPTRERVAKKLEDEQRLREAGALPHKGGKDTAAKSTAAAESATGDAAQNGPGDDADNDTGSKLAASGGGDDAATTSGAMPSAAQPPLEDGEVQAAAPATGDGATEGASDKPRRQCMWYQRGRCGRGDTCKFAHDGEPWVSIFFFLFFFFVLGLYPSDFFSIFSLSLPSLNFIDIEYLCLCLVNFFFSSQWTRQGQRQGQGQGQGQGERQGQGTRRTAHIGRAVWCAGTHKECRHIDHGADPPAACRARDARGSFPGAPGVPCARAGRAARRRSIMTVLYLSFIFFYRSSEQPLE
jgi:hypothetical protein